ncbi:MAG: oligosaccharide flippase family protein [bacterium]
MNCGEFNKEIRREKNKTIQKLKYLNLNLMLKRLLKNTGIYVVVSFFSQTLIFFLWAVLARWLPPEQIGIYVLAMFVIDFFSAVSIFGLDAAITRFYYAKEGIASIFNNAFLVFLIAASLCLILFWSVAGMISSIIPSIGNIIFENLILFSALIFVNSFFNFILAHYTALKKAGDYAKLQFLKTLIFSIFAITLIRLGYGILGVFCALFFSFLPFLFLFLIKEKGLLSYGGISMAVTKKITFYGFPLMLYAAFGVLISYFSRLLLGGYADLATLGIYSFFLMLTLQVNGFWGSFNRAWTPEVFSRFSEDKEKGISDVQFMIFFSSFIYLIGLAFLIIFGELFLFKLIFKEIYLRNTNLFYILLIGPLFTGIYTAAYPLYYYENKTKKILALSVILSLISILFSLILIKNFSQQGAAVSYFLISEIIAVVYILAFKKAMSIPKKIINWTIFLSVLMAIAVVVLLKTEMPFLLLLFVIFGAIAAFIFGDLRKKIYILLSKAN